MGQMAKEKVEKHGIQAIDLTTDLDEVDVINKNIDYITYTLDLEGLNVLFTDDPTEDKIKEDCVPGSPHITFYYQSGVEIELVNPQPGSGYFSSKIAVLEGDDTLKIARRLAKLWKQIKDPKQIVLWRYEDTLLGRRVVPTMEEPLKGKVAVSSGSVFHVDIDKQCVTVEDNGAHFDVGSCLAYLVDL